MPSLHRSLLTILLLALPLQAQGAELARRAFVGISMASVPEAMRAGGLVPTGEGLLIERVIPGSTAEKAGLQAKDILLKLDQAPVRSSADVIGAVRRKRAGDSVSLSLVRDGKVFEQQVTLIGFPPESSSDYETLYEAVESGGALRRAIVTKPKGEERRPAVLFVGGIGCYSIDYPFDQKTPYRQILADLTREGFATMRVEKTGMGDSMGEACATADLDTEVAGYVAGLNALKSKPYVDPEKVFILGHSIGGIVGPLVAEKVPVRGLAVAETVGSTWFEYELINRRRQLKMEGMPLAKIGAQMQLKQWCMHHLLIEKTPRAQILEKRPACAEEMKIPSSDAYLQQIAAINYADLWTRLKPDTLVIYGSADFITSAEEHHEIVSAINAVRPGAATYVEIPDMDHSFYRMKDQDESFRMRRAEEEGETHPNVARIIAEWLKAKAR
ncbi:alpha/beta fold hydrolase [Microvirga sp. ACRRW]|uniref:alpha/beta hydrolase family protein n=1 Tax=Microvirga sp. ACRRW TaxID=2918205 RepID=UPI001EF63F04|nr:alpha/beta fold hydrolase [Microvirga sp. ACRRW]MCG7394223.1 alpha/beta fold hydrolase [Microvirga sp. ACRRW]